MQREIESQRKYDGKANPCKSESQDNYLYLSMARLN